MSGSNTKVNVKRMRVQAAVTILASRSSPKCCGETLRKSCPFLNLWKSTCTLFGDVPLKADTLSGGLLRCPRCLRAAPPKK